MKEKIMSAVQILEKITVSGKDNIKMMYVVMEYLENLANSSDKNEETATTNTEEKSE